MSRRLARGGVLRQKGSGAEQNSEFPRFPDFLADPDPMVENVPFPIQTLARVALSQCGVDRDD